MRLFLGQNGDRFQHVWSFDAGGDWKTCRLHWFYRRRLRLLAWSEDAAREEGSVSSKFQLLRLQLHCFLPQRLTWGLSVDALTTKRWGYRQGTYSNPTLIALYQGIQPNPRRNRQWESLFSICKYVFHDSLYLVCIVWFSLAHCSGFVLEHAWINKFVEPHMWYLVLSMILQGSRKFSVFCRVL